MKEATRNSRRLLKQLLELRSYVVPDAERLLQRWHPSVTGTSFAVSAANLAAYLAFRRRDLRPVQSALSALGVSSLGRCEARVMATLDAVIATLVALPGIGRWTAEIYAMFSLGRADVFAPGDLALQEAEKELREALS